MTMIRKLTLGLVAAASLGAMALTPSVASAKGFGWGWKGGYHHHHFGHHGFYGGPTFVVGGSYNDDCLQRRVVETRRGPRVRLVNVCAF